MGTARSSAEQNMHKQKAGCSTHRAHGRDLGSLYVEFA
jgi:hypothetical protein